MDANEKLLWGRRLRDLRMGRRLSQSAVAEALGLSPRYYQMLERGEKVASVDVLMAIGELFDCSLDYLLKGKTGPASADPLSQRLNALTPAQRACASQILELLIDSWR